MAKRIKVNPVADKAECESLIDEAARLSVERDRRVADLKKAHQELDESMGGAIDEIDERLSGLIARIEPFVYAHQADMLKAGMREGETAISRFGIRTGNPTVTKPKDKTWDVLADLFSCNDRLEHFVRRKLTVNKEAILDGWRDQTGDFKIAVERYGIGVSQTDVVWVEPKADKQV